jgi:hypothetical protein
MQPKRQFHTALKRRTFFDRRVLTYGSSRTVSMSKFIPKDWKYVRISLVDKNPNSVTITITKLNVSESHAQNPQTNKTNRQNP